MRFILDEDLSQRVAEIARSRGLDAVSSHECGRDGLEDEEQLQLAAEEGRCLVTRNYAHLAHLAYRFSQLGRPHCGTLFVPPSLTNDRFAQIAQALIQYDLAHPEGLAPYQVDYLRP